MLLRLPVGKAERTNGEFPQAAQDGDHCAAPEIEAAVNLNDAGVVPGRQCGCSRKRLGNKYRLLPALAYEDRAEHLEGLWQVVSHKSPELSFPFG